MPEPLPSTPRLDGFSLPPEWAPHARTWMLWPERPDNWRMAAEPARQAFAEVAGAIARFEPVMVGANPAQLASARRMLPGSVTVVELPNNDSWMRDNGPTFVVDGRGVVRLVHWRFNAWGGLYSDWRLDERVPERVAEIEGLERYCAPLVMEGGSIHVDGEGTLLTTEACLLNPNRNPELDRGQIEACLHDYTGAVKILWLGSGVFNDETSGHVDNLACFLRPGLVALTWTDDHNDPQYPVSRDALDRLLRFTDAKGRRMEAVKVHQPDPVTITAGEAGGVIPVEGTYARQAGDRMAASYINFYICNNGLVMPAFGDSRDQSARETIARAMPGREVVSVSAREILLGGGNIHCITQQQPLG
ncbi:MAG: agmatine deiminase [Chloroflexi bacterium]|nr:agmatine deiminase [Chloroflexota bacterium]